MAPEDPENNKEIEPNTENLEKKETEVEEKPETEVEEKSETKAEEKPAEKNNVKDVNIVKQIIPQVIEQEMKTSYLDYAMSVIIGRALPDVRDGLKPVHRRILYAMGSLGLFHNKSFRKSAYVVGRVIAEFHPHGDVAVYDSLVRMAQDFSLRYPLVDGQGNFGCFTKDTKVKLTDGRDLSFGDLIKEHKQGKKNYTYTINSKGLVEIAQIKNPRLTKQKEKIIKVVLDNGEEIKCTLDHRFMLRDGAYREAQKLKSGDSLMPAYSRLSTKEDNTKPELVGYQMIYQPKTNKWAGCHVLADNWNLEKDLVEQAKCYNHRVARIEFLNEKADVYDLTVDGTHNFALAAGVFVHNSIDGDSPAHMRYTEARLTKISDELLEDIKKETVNYVPNFDATSKEPVVLPTKIPNLLVNGSSGIAVGMATNIPPHSLNEVCNGINYYIDSLKIENNEIATPDVTTNDLMRYIKGPDFPTGGIICGTSGIESAYKRGRGKVVVRAKTHIEEKKKKQAIIVTEIPYQVNKAQMIEQIADLVRNKKILGISDIRDESDRQGMRIVIELKADANSEIILNQLFKHTKMQTTFGIIMLSLVDNEPRVLGLKNMVSLFVDFRRQVVRRRCEFDLRKAKDRIHVLEGLITAIDDIDSVVQKIKSSADINSAKSMLIADYKLTEIQAKAILEMRLQKLASLEREKIKQEHSDLMKESKRLIEILASELKILNIIKDELKEVQEKHADKRRTEITGEAEAAELHMEDLIEEQDMVITISNQGYIKRLPVATYKKQGRGGRGVIAQQTKEEDFVEHLFIASTHSYVLFFTNAGQVHWLKVYEIPEGSRTSKGKPIVNLLQMKKGEKILAFVPVRHFDDQHYIVVATKKGLVKKTCLSEYSRPRRGGIRGISLRPGDELVHTLMTDGTMNVIIATKNGLAIRFNERDMRPMGRQASGTRGIRLKDADEVVGMVLGEDEKTLLTVTENGYGKRTKISEYRVIGRGGVGVKNIICSERNGKVVAIRSLTDDDEIMLMSKNGIVIRIPAKVISIFGRATQGTRLMKLGADDKLVAAAKIVSE